MGLPGAVWSMTLLYLVVILCPYLIYVRTLFSAQTGVSEVRQAEQ
jgi:hypothetical protein